MNLQEPKKKKTKLKPQLPFPIPLNEMEKWPLYTAHLTDVGSCIIEPEQMIAVHSMGFFGKGSLSRSYPSFGKARYGAPPVVRNRQWLHRQKWLKEVKELNSADYKDTKGIGLCEEENIRNEENIGEIIEIPSNSSENGNTQKSEIVKNIEIDEVTLDSAEEDDICVIINRDSDKYDNNERSLNTDDDKVSSEEKNEEEDWRLNDYDFKSDLMNEDDNQQSGKLLVLPDNDSDTENYLKNVKPRIENEGFPTREALHLTFEETFFLLFGLGCLQVIHFDGSPLDINSAWLYFCKEKPDFIQTYVVYHYYRSKGWVVKPGIKYGGDFLLYQEGPPFYHASYIIIIQVADADSLVIDTTVASRTMTWNNLFGFERLSETAAKEILFAQVLWPSSVPRDVSMTSPEILSEFTVRELLWRRWNPKQHREDVTVEEEDEDSC